MLTRIAELAVLVTITLLIMFLLIYPAPTRADVLANVMVMDNEEGGKIVLTLAPCDLPAGAPIEGAYAAYATEGDGTVHFGCWTRDELSVNTEWKDAPGIYTYAAHLFRLEKAENVK